MHVGFSAQYQLRSFLHNPTHSRRGGTRRQRRGHLATLPINHVAKEHRVYPIFLLGIEVQGGGIPFPKLVRTGINRPSRFHGRSHAAELRPQGQEDRLGHLRPFAPGDVPGHYEDALASVGQRQRLLAEPHQAALAVLPDVPYLMLQLLAGSQRGQMRFHLGLAIRGH